MNDCLMFLVSLASQLCSTPTIINREKALETKDTTPSYTESFRYSLHTQILATMTAISLTIKASACNAPRILINHDELQHVPLERHKSPLMHRYVRISNRGRTNAWTRIRCSHNRLLPGDIFDFPLNTISLSARLSWRRYVVQTESRNCTATALPQHKGLATCCFGGLWCMVDCGCACSSHVTCGRWD